jgi:hypothetical protein
MSCASKTIVIATLVISKIASARLIQYASAFVNIVSPAKGEAVRSSSIETGVGYVTVLRSVLVFS